MVAVCGFLIGLGGEDEVLGAHFWKDGADFALDVLWVGVEGKDVLVVSAILEELGGVMGVGFVEFLGEDEGVFGSWEFGGF